MAETRYRLSASQAEFLKSPAASGGGRGGSGGGAQPARASLKRAMPPVYQQSLGSTCVANAVVALLEYYWDCRTRLSVQFLHAATREIERAGVERNLAQIRAGAEPDPEFESVFHSGIMQLRLLAGCNGGMSSPQMLPYVREFERGVRERFGAAGGRLLQSSFAAVEKYGVCRHSFWPSAPVPAVPLFGETGRGAEFPPGALGDAAKRKLPDGLYLLGTPNNAGEIRAILSGGNGRRAMPVAVTLPIFEGCDGATFRLPELAADADGAVVAEQKWNGRHAVLLVGYEDNAKYPGGGFFEMRNSYGEEWGEGGYGKLPYAYLECFAGEAGTILQDIVDYAGDGYGGMRAAGAGAPAAPAARRALPFAAKLAINIAIGLLIAGVTALWLAPRPPGARGPHPGASHRRGAPPPRPREPKQLVMFDLRGLIDSPEALAALEDLTSKTFESCGVVPVRIGEAKLKRVLESAELAAAGIRWRMGGKKNTVYVFSAE